MEVNSTEHSLIVVSAFDKKLNKTAILEIPVFKAYVSLGIHKIVFDGSSLLV